MTESHTFMPGDDDPLAGVQANPSSAAPEAHAPAPVPRAADAPYSFDPTVNAVDRPSAFDQVYGRGVSNELNKYGHYAMFFGIVSVVVSAILYFGAGIWWLNVGLGVVGVYFGVKGYAAARRGLATNGGLALAGAVMSGLAAFASLLYLILIAIIVAAFLGGVGSA